MRVIPLLLGAAAVAAAARFAANRSRSGAGELRPAPPTPTPTPQPAPAPVATQPGPPEPGPIAPVGIDESPPAAEPPPSAISPATETVKATGPVAPTDVSTPDDSEVEREVEAQLAASPVAADDVTVEVRDRIASLEGSVPDEQTAMAIADDVAHVDGVQGLDNRLRPERETVAETDVDDARDPAGGGSAEKL
jgi:hypothetical protein